MYSTRRTEAAHSFSFARSLENTNANAYANSENGWDTSKMQHLGASRLLPPPSPPGVQAIKLMMASPCRGIYDGCWLLLLLWLHVRRQTYTMVENGKVLEGLTALKYANPISNGRVPSSHIWQFWLISDLWWHFLHRHWRDYWEMRDERWEMGDLTDKGKIS